MIEDREQEQQRFAYHRAGYAVALYTQGRRIPVLSLKEEAEPPVADRDRLLSRWEVDLTGRTRHEVELEILARWTALACEARQCFGDREPPGGWGSFGEALTTLGRRVTRDPEENEAYLEWLRRRALGLLEIPEIWMAVRAVADALLDQRTLSPHQTAEIVTGVNRARRRRAGIAGFFTSR